MRPGGKVTEGTGQAAHCEVVRTGQAPYHVVGPAPWANAWFGAGALLRV